MHTQCQGGSKREIFVLLEENKLVKSWRACVYPVFREHYFKRSIDNSGEGTPLRGKQCEQL